ncbi:MAG: serine protease, partial [Acidimicrobiia bacterium]|nr:serine protease [Acidimicrobiia bacterium]
MSTGRSSASRRIFQRASIGGVVALIFVAGCGGGSRSAATKAVATNTVAAPSSAEGVVATSAVARTDPPATPVPTTPATVQSFEDLYGGAESGVFKVVASTCDGTGIGTGFLVSPSELVTAEHVVAGTVSLAIDVDGASVAGTVIGADA